MTEDPSFLQSLKKGAAALRDAEIPFILAGGLAIWAFLGSDRLGRPIAEHHPDLVVHGHAHAGQFEGFVGAVPVYNVAVPVTRRDFWIFELPGPAEEPKVEQRAVEKPAV